MDSLFSDICNIEPYCAFFTLCESDDSLPWDISIQTFQLRTNRDDLLQFKDTRLEIGAGDTQNIGLRFAPTQSPGTIEILVFINDEDDKNEETFCVRASYA